MFYIAGDSSLEKLLYLLLNQLETVCPEIWDPNINLVFQMDGKNYTKPIVIDENRTTVFIGNTGDTIRGILLNVSHPYSYVKVGDKKYPADDLVWAYHPDNAPDVGEKNTGEPGDLSEFITWSRTHYPAEHYMLVLAGHGGGWKGLLPDDTNHDMLYMGELRSALQAGGTHFDIVAFYPACLMGMVEVGYQIRDEADIMVASQEVMYVPNLAYKEIFGYIQQHPFEDSETIARKFVEYHKQAKINSNFNPEKRIYTLSAVRLGNHIKALAKEVSKFGDDLRKGMEDWGDTEDYPYQTHGDSDDNCQIDVQYDMWVTKSYRDKNFIDLWDFAYHIWDDKNIYSNYKRYSHDVMEAVDNTVIYEKHGGACIPSHGLSIYFPYYQAKIIEKKWKGEMIYPYGFPFDYPWPSRLRNGGDHFAIYAEDHTTEWGKVPPHHPWQEAINLLFRDDTQWDEFLHRYYKPCADAGPDQSFEIEADENDVEVTLNGAGSSDTDGTVKKYYWDLNDKVNSDNGDWDKDGIDETDDDNDMEGATVTHRFAPGRYVVTLTVWDDHYLLNDLRTNSIPYKHWKTDQDKCVIIVIKKQPPEDTVPPTTTISNPPNGKEFHDDIIIVTGNATDNVGITQFGYTLKWKDGETTDSWELDNLTSYEFEFEVKLHDGWNKITVWAKDYAGNEGNDSVTVYYYPEEDTTPPITTEEVGQPSSEGGYQVTPGTPIWLNATDDMSGVNYIYYEVWSDEDGDNNVDTMKANITAYESSVEIYFGEYEIYFGIAEIHFYAVDNAGNIEEMKIKQHLVQEG